MLIGVFAAAAKLSSLLIALAGGGMNPVSLVAKNLVYSADHCAAHQSTQARHAAFVYGHQHDRERVSDGRQSDAVAGSISRSFAG